ncbi:MAG: ABC transporter permease [Acidimicrobiales bacterium]
MRVVWRSFGTGFMFQAVAMRKEAGTYLALVSAPFFTLIFLSIVVHSDRADLASYAVIAPTLMTLWTAVLMFSGEMISEDRENGRLEALVAAPISFSQLVFGRLCACMLLSLPAFGIAVVVAGLAFGHWITIHHPLVFVVAIVVTAVATAATATALSALFVVAPGARIVQNTLSFPMFLVGGVMVPASQLPVGLSGISRAIYLSWGADLLRDSLAAESVEAPVARLATVMLLGAAALAFGSVSIVRFLRRARRQGTLSRV